MTTFYDVFNGDADGICALHQLRRAEPRASTLVTGTKRDIALLERIDARAGDDITVLDVALKRNAAALQRQLARGATCRYFDHHDPGAVPAHSNLKTFIDTAPEMCTSLIVDRYLDGQSRIWAVVAAFGDNLAGAAREAAAPLKLNSQQLAQLQELGEALNYNAYGDSVDDLNYHPADLYQTLARYADPFAFIVGEPVFDVLRSARADDLFLASEVKPAVEFARGAIYVLPDAAWSRRVSGTYANELAGRDRGRAHAVLTRGGSGYRISVRAPLERPEGASEVCSHFASGGGRRGAAGIDLLPENEFERFVAAFRNAFA
jgi:hypothetical protein